VTTRRARPVAETIRDFLAAPRFAVVGASNHPAKFGGQVFRALLRHGRLVHPVNPKEREVAGERCYAKLADLPQPATAVSIVTPPDVTEQVVEEAAASGARIVWMQPGAESRLAIERAQELGLEVVAGGPCLLVELDAE
jgi:predicted CoA-binding protein